MGKQHGLPVYALEHVVYADEVIFRTASPPSHNCCVGNMTADVLLMTL